MYFTISDECYVAKGGGGSVEHTVTVQRSGSTIYEGRAHIWETNRDEPDDATRSLGRKAPHDDKAGGDWEDNDVLYFSSANGEEV